MATSRLALPVMSLYSFVLSMAVLGTDHNLWPSILMFVVSVYLMVELNNRNALMRQYSRMVSCSYIAIMMLFPMLLFGWQVMAVQLCFIATLSLLFATYQKRSALGHKYWAYLFVGIAAMIWPPMLYLVPVLWISEAAFLMSFSMKSFFASILGLLTPLWILLPYIIYAGLYEEVLNLCLRLAPGHELIEAFSLPENLLADDIFSHAIPLLSSLSLLFVVLVTGIVHCLRNIYLDKIQVRMLYNSFLLIVIVAFVGMLAAGILNFSDRESWHYLLAIVIVCVSPLLAHYITFTNTRITNASVVLFLIVSLGVAVYNNIGYMVLAIDNAQDLPDVLHSVFNF